MILFDGTFERCLDRLVAQARPGQVLEAWTFDDRENRRRAEAQLAAKGVQARIRSAYKPLVHAFLEEIDLDGCTNIEIHYPTHPLALENRFRLEAYPLAGMVGGRQIDFIARNDADFHYDVRLFHGSGKETWARILAPNRQNGDLTGETVLSPTGWYIEGGAGPGQRLITDYESVFAKAVAIVCAHAWPPQEPCFEELNLHIRFPAKDETLGVGREKISLREALQEDLYFSLLEFFQTKTGKAAGDRSVRPGQIVPEILESDGPVTLRVETKALSRGDQDFSAPGLASARQPLSIPEIERRLEALRGAPFSAVSRAGRRVGACYHAGSDAAVMISGGQHANETSGIVGALRAGESLALRPGAHFTLSPLENPDGYALHQRLCRDNPHHMHHAARYTAFGDDLEGRSRSLPIEQWNETAIRREAQARSGAALHINLHGYPSHEWTRPQSGYVPRHFAMWTLPKGFFLMVRHHAGWEELVRQLLDQVTQHLANSPELLELNRRQLALYAAHAGRAGFPLIHGFPCWVERNHRHPVPVTLITEYPDETIDGDDFIQAHRAQRMVVLSAYEAWQKLRKHFPGASPAGPVDGERGIFS